MMRLQSSGTVSLFAAVGSEGSVYLTVGKDGGRVQINFANRLREFDAVSADGIDDSDGHAPFACRARRQIRWSSRRSNADQSQLVSLRATSRAEGLAWISQSHSCRWSRSSS